MTVELVVLAPVVVMFALVAIGLGRYEGARQEVADAAEAGADAASVVASPADAQAAATQAAGAALQDQSHMCPVPTVTTDTSTFEAGGAVGATGSVGVTVVCQVDLSDLFVPGLPGHVAVRATQTAPVDPYRVVG